MDRLRYHLKDEGTKGLKNSMAQMIGIGTRSNEKAYFDIRGHDTFRVAEPVKYVNLKNVSTMMGYLLRQVCIKTFYKKY